MSSFRMIITRCLLVVMMGWVVSCSRMPSTLHEESAQTPNLPQTAEALPKRLPQQENLSPQTIPEKAAPFAHEVKWQRETLFSIALWYTGTGNNWKRLADANPTIKPRRIHIGDIILIPEDLLKTRQPLPAEFIGSRSGKKKTSASQRSKPLPKSEEVKLYGPIENDSRRTGTEHQGLPVPLESLD